MDLSAWTEMKFILFLLVFLRNTGLMIGAPFFQSRNISNPLRVGLAFFLAVVFLPLLNLPGNSPQSFWELVFLMIQEFILGLIMGYILYLAFAGLQLAGQLVEVPMGFGMVNVLDPQTGGQMPIIGQLYYLTAIWLFLLVNGHHILLNVLAQSFKILPVGKLFYFTKGLPLIIKNFSQLFWLALQVAIPIIGVLFLTDVGLGVLSKLIPQINVFILGFPIKVFLGITLLILSLPVLLRWLAVNYSNTGSIWTELLRFIKLIGQGE